MSVLELLWNTLSVSEGSYSGRVRNPRGLRMRSPKGSWFEKQLLRARTGFFRMRDENNCFHCNLGVKIRGLSLDLETCL